MSPFPETTAEWCRLLAAPGAPVIRIDANNQGRDTCSLDEALVSGGAFGVIIRADVVAVDVDDDRDWVLGALLEHFAECGQEYLVFSSGRPGHFHLLLVCWSDSHALTAARGLRIFLDTMGRPDVGVRHRQHLRPPWGTSPSGSADVMRSRRMDRRCTPPASVGAAHAMAVPSRAGGATVATSTVGEGHRGLVNRCFRAHLEGKRFARPSHLRTSGS